MNDIDIPWKRYRRSKIAREELQPVASATGQDTSLRWRPSDSSNVLPFSVPFQCPATFEEDAEGMPL